MGLLRLILSIAFRKVQECPKRTPYAKVMAVFNQVALSIGTRRETRLALNFLRDAQAIGDELVVFGFTLSIALQKVQECPKRTPNAKVMAIFNQVAHSISKRRET